MRAGNAAAGALAVAAAVLASNAVSAHRLDEYLQAARIAVEPGRLELELDLTPGIAVAESIVDDIDTDRDGSFSAGEKQAYVQQVLAAVDFAVDGRPLAITPAVSTFPDVQALRRGEGTIRLASEVVVPWQSAGAHHVFFRNRHRRDVSVYLANALVPESDRIAVTAQRHEAEQRDLTIDYVVRSGRSTTAPLWLGGGIAAILAVLLVRPSKSA